MYAASTWDTPQEGRRTVMWFERGAWLERNLRKTAAWAGVDWSVRRAWTKRSLSRDVPNMRSGWQDRLGASVTAITFWTTIAQT